MTRARSRTARPGRTLALATLGLIVVVLVVVGVAMALSPGSRTPDAPPLALVNGTSITRTAYDEYAGVFTDPDGKLTADPDVLLLSLVNQAIVHARVSASGAAVTDAEVDARVDGMAGILKSSKSLRRSGGLEGLRRRVRSFLEFERMRSIVVPGDVGAGGDQTGENGPSPLLPNQGSQTEADRAWERWLADARACASITVLDPSFHVPSSTPAPDCVTPG